MTIRGRRRCDGVIVVVDVVRCCRRSGKSVYRWRGAAAARPGRNGRRGRVRSRVDVRIVIARIKRRGGRLSVVTDHWRSGSNRSRGSGRFRLVLVRLVVMLLLLTGVGLVNFISVTHCRCCVVAAMTTVAGTLVVLVLLGSRRLITVSTAHRRWRCVRRR